MDLTQNRTLQMCILILMFFTACHSSKDSIKITSLSCENQIDPEGINIVRPHVSWIIESPVRGQKQTAWQVLAATSPDKLTTSKADLWNSGKQKSDQSIWVKYQGQELSSGQTCYWKVRIWDKDRHASSWSKPAHWSTGILDESEWKATWIGIDQTFPGEDAEGQFTKLAARYLRKEISVDKKVDKAIVYISGLGLYELHINGRKIGNRVLAPGATDYTKTVFYNTYDVTPDLQEGKNAIGVILGNGRYFAMRQNKPFRMVNYGFPKLLMQIQIRYTDGTTQTISTGEGWKLTAKGPIRENNEFDGEKYDARLELGNWDQPGYNDNSWLDARIVDKPSGRLIGQLNRPIRITGHIKPVSVNEIRPGVFIYDMGQNMVGWAFLTVKGNRGDTITMRFAETLKEDGNLYLDNIRSAKVTDEYILKGDETETWQPKFTYHGFRYVELSGIQNKPDLTTIIGCVVHNDLPSDGFFACSDTMINRIYKNATWGIRGNYRSFPTDCPQRDERMGWLGDRATGCRGESYNYNNEGLYRKWMGDIRDAQTSQGSIPDVCPAYWPMYNDNITWDGTGIMILDMLLDQYADTVSVAENYDAMKKWVLYMQKNYGEHGLMPRDRYGDWCMPPEDPHAIHSRDPKRITSGQLLGTGFFYHDLKLMEKFARTLSRSNDEKLFNTMADDTKKAYNDTFFVANENYYGNNTVTANIISLAFGLVPDEKQQAVMNNVVEQIETEYNGHIPVGLIGIQVLQRTLTQYGRADIAIRFATESTYPSWGYMVKNGATTIWELWNGNTANPAMNSGNHVMLLGDLIIWMHENIAGIKPGKAGFKSIIMKPLVNEGLTFAEATHDSPYGKILSSWKTEGKNNFSWKIQIPVNSRATVYIPASDISTVMENGENPKNEEGIIFKDYANGFAVYEVTSGSWHFESQL